MTTGFKIRKTPRSKVTGAHGPPPARRRGGTLHLAGVDDIPTAIVYCAGNFAEVDGKTANRLVRHSETYRIVSGIDRRHAGEDAGTVPDGVANGIPVFVKLEAAIGAAGRRPDTLVYGMAPSTGILSPWDRGVLLNPIARGLNFVAGLHEFLGDDPDFTTAALARGVSIRDIRRPKPSKDIRLVDGSVAAVGAIRLAVLGTDCAIGKPTTATVLADALNAQGIRTVLVETGQTGPRRDQRSLGVESAGETLPIIAEIALRPSDSEWLRAMNAPGEAKPCVTADRGRQQAGRIETRRFWPWRDRSGAGKR